MMRHTLFKHIFGAALLCCAVVSHLCAQELPTALVCRFLDNYLQQLAELKEESAIRQQLAEDKVELLFGKGVRPQTAHAAPLHAQLQDLRSSLHTSQHTAIHFADSHYLVQLPGGYEVRFPAHFQLLKGRNKKELEKDFYDALIAHPLNRGAHPAAEVPHLSADELRTLQRVGTDCYLQKGDYYQLEAVNANHYYNRQGTPLLSAAYPEESVHNLFVLYAPKELQVAVKQRLYGGQLLTYSLPLHQLLAYCAAEGCQAYCGFEEVTDSCLRGTVVLENPALGYAHTLAFSVHPGVLTDAAAHPVEAELFVYTPIHNVKEFYSEQQKKK